jgi:hypothetical protein
MGRVEVALYGDACGADHDDELRTRRRSARHSANDSSEGDRARAALSRSR